jgi:hypothetical protein
MVPITSHLGYRRFENYSLTQILFLSTHFILLTMAKQKYYSFCPDIGTQNLILNLAKSKIVITEDVMTTDEVVIKNTSTAQEVAGFNSPQHIHTHICASSYLIVLGVGT